MALHTLTDDGHMGWVCPHCQSQQTAHVSHEQVEWTGYPTSPPHHRLIALPPCDCGARTGLKVQFTEEELMAQNMWLPWSGELEERLQLLQRLQIMSVLPEEFAKAGYTRQVVSDEIAQLATIKAAGGMPTNSRAVAERHMQLPGHMEKHGKSLPSQ